MRRRYMWCCRDWMAGTVLRPNKPRIIRDDCGECVDKLDCIGPMRVTEAAVPGKVAADHSGTKEGGA